MTGVVSLRPAAEGDHAHFVSRVDEWWGGRQMAAMLPKLFFVHFPDTTVVAEADGAPVGFLCGFRSRADDAVAYIHFVGVDPGARGTGVGRGLYEWFFERAGAMGCTRVECVTSPANTGSRAFHASMGFTELLAPDYDGRGESRMLLSREL